MFYVYISQPEVSTVLLLSSVSIAETLHFTAFNSIWGGMESHLITHTLFITIVLVYR